MDRLRGRRKPDLGSFGDDPSLEVDDELSVLVPPEILNRSPSQMDGISSVVERRHRIWGCDLIQESGALLGLPQVVMVSGQTFFHRFYYRQSLKRFDAFAVAMTCIFLAAKTEEKPKRIKEVLSVYYTLYQKRRGLHRLPVDISMERYTQWRDKLILIERQMLVDLGFSLYSLMEHPHKFILYYIKALTLSNDVAQRAWNFLNDSLRLDLSLRYPPQVIAATAIYLATRFENVSLPESPPWWTVFDTSKEQLAAISVQILKLYKEQKIDWLEVLTPMDPYFESPEAFRPLTPPPSPPPADVQGPSDGADNSESLAGEKRRQPGETSPATDASGRSSPTGAEGEAKAASISTITEEAGKGTAQSSQAQRRTRSRSRSNEGRRRSRSYDRREGRDRRREGSRWDRDRYDNRKDSKRDRSRSRSRDRDRGRRASGKRESRWR